MRTSPFGGGNSLFGGYLFFVGKALSFEAGPLIGVELATKEDVDMKITVLGVGGMGSRFAIMLHQAGNDITLVDGWQANVDAIRKDGIQANFNGKQIAEKKCRFTRRQKSIKVALRLT